MNNVLMIGGGSYAKYPQQVAAGQAQMQHNMAGMSYVPNGNNLQGQRQQQHHFSIQYQQQLPMTRPPGTTNMMLQNMQPMQFEPPGRGSMSMSEETTLHATGSRPPSMLGLGSVFFG